MGLYAWSARCIPGFSILVLLTVTLLALTDTTTLPFQQSWHNAIYDSGRRPPIRGSHPPAADISYSQLIFAGYNVLIHFLSLLFPLRLCWSLWQITGQVQDINSQHTTSLGNQITEDTKTRTVGSVGGSLSPIDTSGNEHRDDWPEVPKGASGMIYHAILIPIYKEEIDTLRDTLDVLASHAQARTSYDIWLAMEEKDPNAESQAGTLIQAYSKRFRNIRSSIHPSGLEGEVQGKSSNISWAARTAARIYTDPVSRQNCIFTVMDADTQLSSKYFAQLTKMHFEYSDTAATTLYAAPIIFDRNSHKVTTLVRLADIVWCAAGLSGLYPGSTIVIPTSVYSIPLSLVEMVGGWDTNAQSIGEDLHMFLKCYFGANGGLTTKVIYSPASQSNVASDRRGIRGMIRNLQARYTQAMRHMWGALDTGYACEQAGQLCRRMFSRGGCSRPSVMSLAMLTHRLFEAHFLTVHLFLLLISSEIYKFFTPVEDIPPLLYRSIIISGQMRAGAFICMLCAFFVYESYHAVCVQAREDEMRRAGLYQRLRGDFSKPAKRDLMHWVQYLMFPIPGIVFVTLPSIIAQLSHFGTERLDYVVSLKPTNAAASLFELNPVVEAGIKTREHTIDESPD